MKKLLIAAALLLSIGLFTAGQTFAHGGGCAGGQTNPCCHNDYRNGTYHCH